MDGGVIQEEHDFSPITQKLDESTGIMLEESLPAEEQEFRTLLSQIGGKERIYLVSDARRPEAEDGAETLLDFIRDMFHDAPAACVTEEVCGDSLPTQGDPAESQPQRGEEPLPGRPGEPERRSGQLHAQRTTTKKVNLRDQQRSIDFPVIVFVFRQEFLQGASDERYVTEILKDVRMRTRRAGAPPAILGLVHTAAESDVTRRCAERLEDRMRAVFRRHPPESIWVGVFLPKTESKVLAIKKNACRALHSSQAADHCREEGRQARRLFRCLPWPSRRGHGDPASSFSTSKQRGDTGSKEEGIPLKSSSQSAGPHTETGSGTEGDN